MLNGLWRWTILPSFGALLFKLTSGLQKEGDFSKKPHFWVWWPLVAQWAIERGQTGKINSSWYVDYTSAEFQSCSMSSLGGDREQKLSPPAVGPFLSHFFHKCNKNTRGAFADANTKMPIATSNDLDQWSQFPSLHSCEISGFYYEQLQRYWYKHFGLKGGIDGAQWCAWGERTINSLQYESKMKQIRKELTEL